MGVTMIRYCDYCGKSYAKVTCKECGGSFETCGCNYGQRYCDDCEPDPEKEGWEALIQLTRNDDA